MEQKQRTYDLQEPKRLDVYLSEVEDLSRTSVQEMIKDKLVFVNGKNAKRSYQLVEGDVITFTIPDPEPMEAFPEDIPLDILYEDDDLIIINKPKGMVVHPAPGNYSGTLVNALLYHFGQLSNGDTIRPGIVHRIDKDTTGCLVVCKNDKAHQDVAKQIENKTCHREYLAIVDGLLDHKDGLIDAPIGRDPSNRQRMSVVEKNAKEAITHFHVIERFAKSTYIRCQLETGRTHQIRVHMKYIHHPVMGDDKYGKKCAYMDTQGQVLHAHQLTLVHPTTKKEMTFTAPLPAYFEELLEILRKESHGEEV